MIEVPKLDSEKSIPTQRLQGPTRRLTPREREVLILSGIGLSQEEIARNLPHPEKKKPISIQTVKNHTTNLCRKLMEISPHDALARTLITGEIKIQEVLPNGYHKGDLEDLTIDEEIAWAQRAQRVGYNFEIAESLSMVKNKYKVKLDNVHEKLGVRKNIEATVIYFAAHPELMRHHGK